MKIKGRQNYRPGPKDECGSPPYSIEPLLDHIEAYRTEILGISKEDFIIWDPAIGLVPDNPHTGLIDGFSALGYGFIGTKDDFFTLSIKEVQNRLGYNRKISMIITNPPFSVALKRQFINKCESIWTELGVPYALLMNTTTLVEKINGKTLRGCAVHIPLGRICFNMPNKGWGTESEPTKATFATNWFSRGLVDPFSIQYSDFDMSDHFKASRVFDNR